MNLFESPIMIDYDGAKLYKHAIEMWNHKTLFIPDWKYITTMELDCSLLLALPFYALCRNIFLSFGIANILLIFTYVAVVYAIFQRTPYQKYAFLAVNLILIPYSSGMLEYFNMMFFNGAQYVLKVLIPLLFILLLTTEREKERESQTVSCLFSIRCCCLLPLCRAAFMSCSAASSLLSFAAFSTL